jgi:acetylornithine deacetylase/succinyl-diaminopimelate desuccinylase-like protein
MTDPRGILRELVALPSVNPAFLPAGDPRAGEHRVADFLAATAARGGLDVEFQPVLPGRRNLLARCSPHGPARRHLLLAPHLDTVGGDSSDLFTPREHQGRLHGRGACDTKGSIAAMLAALLQLAASAARPRETEIVFAGLVDEENAQAGSRTLAASGFQADLAIVGEPTQLEVVTAHKGAVWLEIESRGKAAHGACPHLGRNAIRTMAAIVGLLEGQYAAQLRRRRHPLLGHPTINVGTIAGGTQPNIVPDRCTISIDRRTLPRETQPGVRREVQALLRRHQLEARLRNLRRGPCDALETDCRHPLVRAFLGVIGQSRGVGAHYFCDAAILASAGIPSVVFGPGSIAQAHTTKEWVSLRQLEQATRRLLRFLESLP